MYEPVWMHPYYRCDGETPWGGNTLKALFSKDIPSDVTGESLEVSALPGRESVAVGYSPHLALRAFAMATPMSWARCRPSWPGRHCSRTGSQGSSIFMLARNSLMILGDSPDQP